MSKFSKYWLPSEKLRLDQLSVGLMNSLDFTMTKFRLTAKIPERKWSLSLVPYPSGKVERYSSESENYYATVTEKPSLSRFKIFMTLTKRVLKKKIHTILILKFDSYSLVRVF